jgi:uncharacterized protein (DUF58 family)
MSLAQRTYILLVSCAVLAIAGLWSADPALQGLWRLPAALLLAGVALEGLFMRRTVLRADLETPPRAFLGRQQPASFIFENHGVHALDIEYAPLVPPGFEGPGAPRSLSIGARSVARDGLALLPVHLGAQSWPAIPLRILGRFGLVWWAGKRPIERRIVVAPDTLRAAGTRPRGAPAGLRPRRVSGAGAELHQLRAYVPGDPPARIDWKATARLGQLVSREFSEDQHLDVLVAIDAGRASRVRAGRLDRLGLYANIAARFAERVTPNDDRVGLLVFSDRPLAACAPGRGHRAVMRIRRALEQLEPDACESEPLAAAVRIRVMLRRRSLVVLLTDLTDTTSAEELAHAVRLLSPPHLAVVAGVSSPEIAELAIGTARSWRDPWVALAAQEHESRAAGCRAVLRRLGAPVIAARADILEQAVLNEYESLRRAHRI